MNRLLLAVMIGGSLLGSRIAVADDSPYVPSKQFSADQVITTKEGQTVTSTVHMDGGKIRSEMNTSGMQIISIIRPDQKKIYSVMVAQKMVMAMPYDPEKMKQQSPGLSDDVKFETVGPETVDGVACTKYKSTTKEGKVFFTWVNTATKAPVKMAAEDGSFTLVWKNYQAGPQDPALFEPPADFKVMEMPGQGGQ